MYPPAWMLNGRTPTEDLTIDGYTVPKGSVIYISPWVMHHDARWFPDPYAFKPERWADDYEKSIPRYAYFPFGGGPRVCIGNSFALMEARLIVAAIAQRFHVDIDPSHTVVPEPLITLRPKDGLPVTLRERQPAAIPSPAHAELAV
jgi:cytochrome P450